MPNTVAATLPGTLLGQIEVATIAAAGAAYLKNPVAGRAILQAAAVALFEPPVGVLLTAAIATAVAAYCISQWGADSPPQGTYAADGTIFDSRGINYIEYSINFNGSIGVQSFTATCGTGPSKTNRVVGPTIVGTRIYGPNQVQLNGSIAPDWGGSSPPPFITQRKVFPCTGTNYITTPTTGFPALTDDEQSLIAQVGQCTIPRVIPKKPATADDPNQTIPPLIAGVKTDQLDCCAEQRTQYNDLLSKLAAILARVKKACNNLGLPDLDSNNTGNITGQNSDTYATLSSSIQELLRALGPWPSNAVTNFNSSTVQYSSVRRGIDTLKDRLNYDVLESTPTPTNVNQMAGDVQTHIRYTKYDGVDASFQTGYADSSPAKNHLKIIFTDTSKWRNKQNASMHIPNPKTTLTDAQIKGAIPVRILGPYWCTLLMADKTKIVGWFPSSTVGQTQLTALADLTISGVSNPVRFTTTLKQWGVPAISGTSLTPTGYAYNKLNSDGTYTLVTKRI